MAVRWKRVFLLTMVVLMAVILFAPPVFAAPDSGQVSTAIESTWKTAAGQIKTVTNNVIFLNKLLYITKIFFCQPLYQRLIFTEENIKLFFYFRTP